MTNRIVLKKSSVAAKVPLAGDLEYGELALNYTDGKLFFKNASNVIKSFTIDDSVVTLTGTQTLTNKTIAAGSNTITGLTNTNLSGSAGITNANLANSSVTIGSTAVSLGATATTLAGLTSVTSTTFVGALTGNATNVTGTVAIANGGTGQTTRQAAMDALAGAVTSGQYLRGDGNDVVMSAIQAADVPTLNQNTTGSAATLTTARTIAITGDLTYTSGAFNGSANVTGTGTLATVNSNVGSFTNASVTVNAKGLVTAVSSGTALVTGVTATSPVLSSGGTAPVISLAAGYGDTQNPYASKTANNFLAAPNGSAGAPTFRAIVAADIPTLNQNTTGNAATATTLQTARTINTVSFNGSANIVVEPFVENDDSTDADRFITFVDSSTAGHQRLNEDSNFTYNPATGTVTSVGGFAAPVALMSNNITTSYSIPAGYNAISAGPITVANGVSVTVPSGSVWTIV
jgi:hypothetical protein